jgi:Uma2 family endonuclease
MSALAKPVRADVSIGEFLALPPRPDGVQFELVDGELRAQDAPSDAHGTILTNVARLLGNHLHVDGSSCRAVTGGGLRPHLRADWNYRIPDVVVTCARNEEGMREVPNPVLVIELLSPTNRKETWDNVRNYVTLPSVVEIIMIETTRVEAMVLRRDAAGAWPANPTTIVRPEPVSLASIDLDLAMSDLYWGTHLAGRSN